MKSDGVKKCDVFISYRRDGGAEIARMIRDELCRRGYNAFFDLESLSHGKFNEQILTRIKECSDFILICSPGALDRCRNEDDWVRKELTCALQNKKNIIPVMMKNFSFPEPDTLPPEIRDVCNYQALTMSVEIFDWFINKLVEKYLTPLKPLSLLQKMLLFFQRDKKRVIAAVLAACLLVSGGTILYSQRPVPFPNTAIETTYVEQLLEYSMTNLSTFDSASQIYKNALSELLKYTQGSSPYRLIQTFDEYAQSASERIAGMLYGLTGIPQSLIDSATPVVGDKIALGDMASMEQLLQTAFEEMTENLSSIVELYHENGCNLKDPTLVTILDEYIKLADLTEESVILTFNKSFLSITNNDTLRKIKTEWLPSIPSVSQKYTWITSADDISSLLGRNDEMQKAILANLCEVMQISDTFLSDTYKEIAQIEASIEDLSEQEIIEDLSEQEIEDGSIEAFHLKLDQRILYLKLSKKLAVLENMDKAAGLPYDEAIAKCTEAKARLEEKAEKLRLALEEVAEKQALLAAAKEEAKEKFKPLQTDPPEMLWDKARKFIALKMPEEAVTCYEMYAQADASEETACFTAAAAQFALQMEQTGITDGVIVCMYEAGLPHQAFAIGDILYEVNGTAFQTTEEFTELRGDGNAEVSVLRFLEDGSYTLLKLPYDSSLGRVGLLPLG